jgi:hypothetical protein
MGEKFVITKEIIDAVDYRKDLSFDVINKPITEDYLDIQYAKYALAGKELKIKQAGIGTYILSTDHDIKFINHDGFEIKYGKNLFSYTTFRRINLTNVETSALRVATEMFKHCGAAEINMKDANLTRLVDATSMFEGTKIVLKINLSDLLECTNTEKMFRNTVILSDLDTLNIRLPAIISMLEMFKFSRLDVPHVKIGVNSMTLETMADAFKDTFGDISTLEVYELGEADKTQGIEINDILRRSTIPDIKINLRNNKVYTKHGCAFEVTGKLETNIKELKASYDDYLYIKRTSGS